MRKEAKEVLRQLMESELDSSGSLNSSSSGGLSGASNLQSTETNYSQPTRKRAVVSFATREPTTNPAGSPHQSQTPESPEPHHQTSRRFTSLLQNQQNPERDTAEDDQLQTLRSEYENLWLELRADIPDAAEDDMSLSDFLFMDDSELAELLAGVRITKRMKLKRLYAKAASLDLNK